MEKKDGQRNLIILETGMRVDNLLERREKINRLMFFFGAISFLISSNLVFAVGQKVSLNINIKHGEVEQNINTTIMEMERATLGSSNLSLVVLPVLKKDGMIFIQTDLYKGDHVVGSPTILTKLNQTATVSVQGKRNENYSISILASLPKK